MTDEQDVQMTELELLEQGVKRLDDALCFLIEMENAAGQVLAHFIHAAITMGEQIIEAHKAQADAVDDQ